MKNEYTTSRGLKTLSWVTVLIAGILGFSTIASATVDVEYILNTGSYLYTPTPDSFDYIDPISYVPAWTENGTAAATLNEVHISFTDSGGIADGPITVTLMDWSVEYDAGITGAVDITGLVDVSLGTDGIGAGGATDAVGTLSGVTVPAAWGTDATGELHNEITCTDLIAPGTVCNSGNNLPDSGETEVTHEAASTATLKIDIATTAAGAIPMTFSNGYDDVEFEVTIDQTAGRQYFHLSTTAVKPLPLSDTATQLLIVALMSIAGIAVLNSKRGGMTAAL